MADNPEATLRIGDAERQQMSDVLAEHFSDGRLDESEFRERMDKAMAAKTTGDLSGLLSDLPPLDGRSAPAPPSAARPRRRGRKLELVLVVFIALLVARALSWPWPFVVPHVMSLVAVLLGLLFLRMRYRRHHFHRHPNTTDA
jgi:hypothetical protein